MDIEIETKKKVPVVRILAILLILAFAVASAFLFLQNLNLRKEVQKYMETYSPEFLHFNSITVPRFREMVASGEDFLISIGRPTCPDCRVFEPELISLAGELGMTDEIYYLNVGDIRSNSTDEEWAAFKQSVGFMYTPAMARYADGSQVSMIQWDENALTVERARAWLEEQKSTMVKQ